MQECGAAFGEATDRLHTLPVDDRAFIARVPGPFVDVLKDMAVNSLKMRLVELPLRAVAFGNFRHAEGRGAVFFDAQLGIRLDAEPVAQHIGTIGIVRRVRVEIGTFGRALGHRRCQQKTACVGQAAFRLDSWSFGYARFAGRTTRRRYSSRLMSPAT